MIGTRSWTAGLSLVVVLFASACASDVADSGAAPQSAPVTSASSELLIEPTVNLAASGRPVVLWFWAPG